MGTLNHNFNLKKAQKLLDLTQKDLGIYAGVSVRTVNSWFTGDRQCPDHISEMILRLAEVDARALENGEATTGMRRWAVIASDGGDEFITVCGSKADALRDARISWEHYTEKEKARATRFEVSLIHVSLIDRQGFSGRFDYYTNENGEVDSVTYETAVDFLE